jgi:hypothetical protein
MIDVLAEIARRHETSIAAIALAWVQGRAGVASTIIGARTLDQLDDNLKALDVVLSADDLAKLDAQSKPRSTFIGLLEGIGRPILQNGVTVNGFASETWPLAPKSDRPEAIKLIGAKASGRLRQSLAPRAGLEPATRRLTVACSTN